MATDSVMSSSSPSPTTGICIRVMRLEHPSFYPNRFVPIDQFDSYGTQLNEALTSATGQTSIDLPIDQYSSPPITK